MIDQVDAAVAAMRRGAGGAGGLEPRARLSRCTPPREACARRDGRRVDRLVLLAPALDLVRSLEEEFGPAKMAAWEHSGRLPIFHYGDNAMRELGWDFMPDARRYDSDGRGRSTCRADLPGRATTRWCVPEGVERWAALAPATSRCAWSMTAINCSATSR